MSRPSASRDPAPAHSRQRADSRALPGRPLGVSLAVAALLLVASAGCDRRAEAVGPPASSTPQVTVALPLVADVTEFTEHTGRTEAPATVEIRPRASGHLTQVAFTEGDLVKKGDLLFVIDPRPYQAALQHARAELESVKADLELARKNTARIDQLFKMSAVAERDWDTQRAQLDQFVARRASAAAAVSSAELDLDYAYVRSPITGRIGRALVTAGNLVGPGGATPLATVVSVDPLYVYIDVDEVHGLQLRAGDARVAHIGFPGEDGYPHEANIDFVDNRVDPTTGTIKVRAVVKNPDGRLAHGLFARVRIGDGAPRPALLISDRAVGTDQDRRFVWVVGPERTAQYRAVKLGPLQDGLRVVREGISAGDQVVVRGLQRVRKGGPVATEVVAMRAADAQLAAEERAP